MSTDLKNARIVITGEPPNEGLQPEVTLADLIPDGCTVFRFRNTDDGNAHVALRTGWGGEQLWEVTGVLDVWDDLNELGFDADVDLTTVIPLTVHPDYVEAQSDH